MQDPSVYTQIKEFPDQEHLKCPRCDSDNTKFCYYNNYNLSQPRHFCKNCRRYWTKGGALRNVPVGGASRKNSKRSAPSSPSTDSSPAVKRPAPSKSDDNVLGKNGETLSLIGEGQFGDFSSVQFADDDYLAENSVEPGSGQNVDAGQGQDQQAGLEDVNADGFLNDHGGETDTEAGTGTTECWSGNTNVWPGLSIYTPPGSTFH